MLRTHCELMGYELTICDDPVKALEMIKIEKFHIVLLDINMPKMTGIEMLKKINATRPNIQVIMITAFTTNVH